MNIVIWIITVVLALVMLGAGAMKLSKPKADLVRAGQGWPEDFSAGTVKTIGALEVLAALGLILPGLFGVATVLVPLAALGVAITMVGAAITHARRREYPNVGVNVVLLVLALVVAITRFGPYAL